MAGQPEDTIYVEAYGPEDIVIREVVLLQNLQGAQAAFRGIVIRTGGEMSESEIGDDCQFGKVIPREPQGQPEHPDAFARVRVISEEFHRHSIIEDDVLIAHFRI
jgi:hypothetical protein